MMFHGFMQEIAPVTQLLKQAPFSFRILLVHFGTRGIAWAWGISDPGISGFHVQRVYS